MGKDSWFMKQAAARGVVHGLDPAAYDPEYVSEQLKRLSKVFGPGRYFDVHVHGWDNVPKQPTMMVSNHSGGTTVLDGLGMMTAWYGHFGVDRPVHGLAHELVFATHTTGRYFERCGLLRARFDTAERALRDHGHSVLVMPGGDQDVWRPASQRYDVCFAGRTGYARTAIRLGTPVLPIAHAGAHHTLHVLAKGRRIAKAFGIHKVARADVFPVHLSFPWGLTIGPWPHLPPPARFDYAIGKPIKPPAIIPPGRPIPDEVVLAYDAEIRASIQSLLDELKQLRRREPSRMEALAHRAVRRMARRVLREPSSEDLAFER